MKFEEKNCKNYIFEKSFVRISGTIFAFFRNHKNPKIMIFQWFFIKNELWHPQKSWFFHFSFIYKQKMKNEIMIFGEDSFFHFWVHLDPIFIKISRFHALQQEKLVTKVILISLSWTCFVNAKHHSIQVASPPPPLLMENEMTSNVSTPRINHWRGVKTRFNTTVAKTAVPNNLICVKTP